MKATEVLRREEKIAELIACIEEQKVRAKGFRAFAQKNGVTFDGVKNYFYKAILNPELDSQLPRGASVNLERQKKAKRTPKPEAIPVERAIMEEVKKKGEQPLEKEDIQRAAEKAGVHYHTALSTWGNMVANAKTFLAAEPCGDRSCFWFKGDTFATLAKNGMPFAEIAKISHESISDVEELVQTCTAFPKGARTYPLPFKCYSLVRDMENPGEWLQKAVSEDWSTKELAAAIEGKPFYFPEQPNEIVSLEYIQEMHNLIKKQSKEIAELKNQLAAARKVSLAGLRMLVRKDRTAADARTGNIAC